MVPESLSPLGFRPRVWICSFMNNRLCYLIGGTFCYCVFPMKLWDLIIKTNKTPRKCLLFPLCTGVQIKTKNNHLKIMKNNLFIFSPKTFDLVLDCKGKTIKRVKTRQGLGPVSVCRVLGALSPGGRERYHLCK